MDDVTFFVEFGNSVREQLQTFATSVSDAMVSKLAGYIVAAITIYFFIKAILIMSGRSREPFSELFLDCFWISCIAFLAVQSGNFANWVMPVVYDFENQLIEVINQGAFGHNSSTSVANAWSSLDTLLSTLMQAVNRVIDAWKDLSWWSNATLIMVFLILGTVMVVVSFVFMLAAGGILLTNEMFLSIVFGLGPLFICLLMFPVTRPMFQGWFRSTLSFVFTIVILVAVIALFSETFNTQLDKVITALKEGKNVKVMTVVTPVVLFCAEALTAGTVMKLVPAMASALVGGINMNAVGLGQMMMGAWGRGTQIVQATGNVAHGVTNVAVAGYKGTAATVKAGQHAAEETADLMNAGMSSALLAANQWTNGNLVTAEQVKQLTGNVENMQNHFTLGEEYSMPVNCYTPPAPEST